MGPVKGRDKGIDLARADNPEHADMLETFKGQLLIAFVRRLGGRVDIPVSEVDETGGFSLAFSIVDGVFHFRLEQKA